MPDVAALSVSIIADTAGLESGLARANQAVSGAGSAISAAFGVAAVGAVAGLSAAIATSVKSAADFEKQLSGIQAVSGATSQQLDQIRTTALQLGKDTSFSASEAAAGMEELIKAGVGLQDALSGGARAALDLAAASGTAVSESAAIMSNAMNAFGLEGDKATHVADELTQAANASATSVHDLGYSFSAVAAVAHTVGLSFDDTTVALAELAQAGLKGSDAGTSLKTMLINLNPSSKTAISAMKELGIITADGSNQFFDAAGNAKSLADIQEVLRTSTANLTKEEKLHLLQQAFGTDALRAAAILSEQGAEGQQKMAAAMIASGTAQDAANTRLDNLWGSLEKFKGSVETAAIMIGSLFTPAIKSMVDSLTDDVNTVIDVIDQLPDAWETVKEAFAGDWSPDASIRPFTNAIGLLALAIKPLVPAFTTAFNAIKQIVDKVLAGDIMGAIQTWLQGLQDVNAQLVPILAQWGQAFLAWIAPMIPPVLAALAALGAQLLAWIASLVPPLVTALLTWATAFVEWITPMVPLLLNALVALGAQILAWIAAQIPPLVAQLALWGAEFVAWIAPQVAPLLAALGALLLAITGWIVGTALPAIVAQLLQWGAAFVAWIGPATQEALVQFGVMLGQFTVWFADTGLPAIQAQLVLWRAAMSQWIKDSGPEVAAALAGLIVIILEAMRALPGQIMAIGMETGRSIVTGMIQGAQGDAGKLTDALKSIITTALQTAWNGAKASIPGLGAISNLVGGGGGGGSASPSGTTHAAPYMDLINRVSREMHEDPALVAALMDTEASGPGSTSPAGAAGLMQVVQSQRGYVLPGENPYDPETSIRQGIRVIQGKRAALGAGATPAQIAGAYFGYGTDAGGMTTGVYQQRFQQNYNQYSVSDPRDARKIPLGGGATPGGWNPQDISDIIDMGPPWEQTMQTMQASGEAAFNGIGTAVTTAGATMVSASTDSLGNVTTIYSDASGVIGATITDAAGVIVNQWGSMGTQVVDQSTAMTAGVSEQAAVMTTNTLTSVTDLGTGTLTTIQDMSGNTVATVTDMTGQVTAQSATLANGVQLNMSDMAAGVLVSTTDLGTGFLTIMQDMSGNTIATITDLNGNVVQQITQMGGDVASAATDMNATVTDQVTTMTSGAVTMAKTMASDMTSAAEEAASGTVEQYKQMSDDVIEAAQKTADGAMEAMNNIEFDTPDVSNIIKAMDKVKGAAEKAASAVGKITGGNKGDGKNPLARAGGGPVFAGESYIVGENHPELFVPWTNGNILPDVPSGGGSGTIDDRVLRVLERIEAKLNGGDQNFNLTVNSNAPTEPIIQDFAILKSLARSAY